jgi:inosine-uridine nucleoside N-ribohydrolase
MPANAPSHYVHGDEGFGNFPAITPSRSADPRPAHVFLADTIRAFPGEVILCPIGPLTNIARLLEHDPAIAKLVKKVVIMGGAVDCPGNVTPYAEANIWNDPHAADIVFSADWDMELIGLDVTSHISCDAGDFKTLASQSPDIGGFLDHISQFYITFYHGVIGRHVCLMHDPSAVIIITNRAVFDYESIPLEVVCSGEQIGATIRTGKTRRLVKVAKQVNATNVRKIFLDICSQCDKINS